MRQAMLAVFTSAIFSVSIESQPLHSATVELEFSPRVSASYWMHGFLPKYSRAMNGSESSVWMYDRDGKETIPPTAIRFDDAPLTQIHAVTADDSGYLYASVEAWAPGGSGTGMICRVSPGGRQIKVIRTDDFLAVALAVTRHGEIWAFGSLLELQATKQTELNYMTLWRFDAEGRVVDKLLPRSSFSPNRLPTNAYGSTGWPVAWATSSRVGIYSANCTRWIEYDIETGKVVIDSLVPSAKASDGSVGVPSVIAMTESNDVYAQWGFSTAVHEVGIRRLDKTSWTWIPVREPGCPDGCSKLYGADGDALILRSGAGTSHSWTFSWLAASLLSKSEH